MEIINERVRPMRSATTPNNSPPIAEATSVSELRKPAVRVSIENSRMRYVSTSEYSITSMASSIQPNPPARSDLRSAGVTWRGQPKSRGDWLVAAASVLDGRRVSGIARDSS